MILLKLNFVQFFQDHSVLLVKLPLVYLLVFLLSLTHICYCASCMCCTCWALTASNIAVTVSTVCSVGCSFIQTATGDTWIQDAKRALYLLDDVISCHISCLKSVTWNLKWVSHFHCNSLINNFRPLLQCFDHLHASYAVWTVLFLVACVCLSVKKSKKQLYRNWCNIVGMWDLGVIRFCDIWPWQRFLYFMVKKRTCNLKTVCQILILFYLVMYLSSFY